jgi:ribosome-associated protein
MAKTKVFIDGGEGTTGLRINERFEGWDDIEILKIDEISVIADYLVIANGDNPNQIRSMLEQVEQRMMEAGFNTKRIEGNAKSTWILMDYGDVIVHIFSRDDRLFYDLERIWQDGEDISRENL